MRIYFVLRAAVLMSCISNIAAGCPRLSRGSGFLIYVYVRLVMKVCIYVLAYTRWLMYGWDFLIPNNVVYIAAQARKKFRLSVV